ncbi:hypothetical protein ACIRS1_34905 [Kitasatospora sp. NPDC101176]|uniref:hypothetical protein n=1 Tax=Kitasatospora sp. NPDC101176 TaxID=3364099 RepID=UPI0038047819
MVVVGWLPLRDVRRSRQGICVDTGEEEGSLRYRCPMPGETIGPEPEPISRVGRQSGELDDVDDALAFL